MDTHGNSKKKVLIFCDWYVPGYKAGGPIQSCRNIVELLHPHFDFYIFTSDRDLGDAESYAGVPLNQWLNLNDKVNVWYASSEFITGANIKTLVQQLEPHAVYCNSMFSKHFTLLPLWILKRMHYRGKVILAPRGMLHAGALRQKTLKKKIFLLLFRMSGWHRHVVFHATDHQEIKDISTFFPAAARPFLAENIPNTDKGVWKPAPKWPGHLRCVFVSRIHPKKNLAFILKILQELPAGSQLHFDIYGNIDDESYAAQCRQLLGYFPERSIVFRGSLPNHEVFDTLKQYHIFVLPTLGENFGHAIYEALSAGLPVLISDQTPWRNLSTEKAGWDIPLQQSHDYLLVIKQLLQMDQQEYNEWSLGARNYAQKYIDSTEYILKYISLFQ